MAQFEVGQKVVCVESENWTIQAGSFAGQENIGPKKYEVAVIDTIEVFPQHGGVFLSFSKYDGHPRPTDRNFYPAACFRPIESWPDLQQSAVLETVAGIRELQPA